jgi:hypothetical protein
MKKQKINIEIVPLKKQRYETLGDYYFKKGILEFKITDTGNPLYNKLILIHELVEQTLTEALGIKEEQILRHDLQFEKLLKDGKVGFDDEPGDHKNSPYRKEHVIAEVVERLMINHLNLSWKNYDKEIYKVFTHAHNK